MSERPIIVLGNQKAGTTAIAALLAKYGGLSATLDFRYLSADWLRGLHDRSIRLEPFISHYKLDFSRGLVKEPHLSLLYPQLSGAFPQARFVMIVRDPRDNIRSILNRLAIPGDLDHLEADRYDGVNPLWHLVLDGRPLGIGGDQYIERLAHRWNHIADAYLAHRESMHLVRYEDFLADKEGIIAQLASQCSLPQRRDISSDLDVQYQPRGNRKVTWSEFFSPRNLERIEQLCGGRLEPLGYTPIEVNAAGVGAESTSRPKAERPL